MKCFFTCSILLLVAVSMSASSFLNPLEASIVDGRSNAMGGTAVLSTENAFLVFNNPALMTKLRGIHVDCSLRAWTGSSDASYSSVNESDSLDVATDVSEDFDLGVNVNGFAIATSFPLEQDFAVALGVGWRRYLDMSYSFDSVERTTDAVYGYESVQKNKNDNRGGLQFLTIAFGCAYKEMLHFGFSVDNTVGSDFTGEYVNEIRGTINNECSHDAFCWTISGAVKLRERYTISVRYRSSYSLKLDLKQKTQNTQWYSEGFYDFSIPEELIYAVNIQVSPLACVAVEYTRLHLNQYRMKRVSDFNIYKSSLYNVNTNGSAFRIGVEYGSRIRVRVGYCRRDVPVDFFSFTDENYVVDFSKDANENSFTCGFGMEVIKNATVDAFFTHTRRSATLRYGGATELTFSKEDTRLRFGLTASYKFNNPFTS